MVYVAEQCGVANPEDCRFSRVVGRGAFNDNLAYLCKLLFMLLLSSADFFFKINFSKYSFRVSKSLDLDLDRRCGPDLGPSCL